MRSIQKSNFHPVMGKTGAAPVQIDVIRKILISSGALPPDKSARVEDEYFPLFPPEIHTLKKETYLLAHEKLLSQMRVQMKRKNKRGIEQTGKKLHRLRKRYRARFAA